MNIKRKIVMPMAAVLALAVGSVSALAIEPTGVVNSENQLNLEDLDLANCAANSSNNPAIRNFANQVLQDRRQAEDGLHQVAGNLNMSIQNNLDNCSSQQVDQIEDLQGQNFDRAFLNRLADNYRSQIQDLNQVASGAAPSPLQQYARDQLPLLNQHLNHAQFLESRLEGSQTNGYPTQARPSAYQGSSNTDQGDPLRKNVRYIDWRDDGRWNRDDDRWRNGYGYYNGPWHRDYDNYHRYHHWHHGYWSNGRWDRDHHWHHGDWHNGYWENSDGVGFSIRF